MTSRAVDREFWGGTNPDVRFHKSERNRHIVVTIDGREWTIVLEGENVDVGTGHIHVRGSSHIHVDSGCA